jgi:hypothetical protein
MTKHSRLFALGLCLLFAVSASVHAEVSVRTDRDGHYVTTQVTVSGPHGKETKIWSPSGRGNRRAAPLNPYGDANGDLFPAIAESTDSTRHPWVVWSRFNGVSYDVAWSRWTDNGWSPIEWISPGSGLEDDLDPDVAFDKSGRTYCVWWSEEDGTGRVYASNYEGRRWTGAYLLSDPAEDSRYPTFYTGDDGLLRVRYLTPRGLVDEVISQRDPDTITDDINPQISIHREGVAFLERNN